jgi:hypothetical protein
LQAAILAGVLGVAAWGIQAVEIEEATAAGTQTFTLFEEDGSGCIAPGDMKHVIFSKDDSTADLNVTSTGAATCDGNSYSGANIDLWSQVVVANPSGGLSTFIGSAGAVDWTPAGGSKHAEGSSIVAKGSCYYTACTSSFDCGSDYSGKIKLSETVGSRFCGYTGTF